MFPVVHFFYPFSSFLGCLLNLFNEENNVFFLIFKRDVFNKESIFLYLPSKVHISFQASQYPNLIFPLFSLIAWCCSRITCNIMASFSNNLLYSQFRPPSFLSSGSNFPWVSCAKWVPAAVFAYVSNANTFVRRSIPPTTQENILQARIAMAMK